MGLLSKGDIVEAAVWTNIHSLSEFCVLSREKHFSARLCESNNRKPLMFFFHQLLIHYFSWECSQGRSLNTSFEKKITKQENINHNNFLEKLFAVPKVCLNIDSVSEKDDETIHYDSRYMAS